VDTSQIALDDAQKGYESAKPDHIICPLGCGIETLGATTYFRYAKPPIKAFISAEGDLRLSEK
jgi:hypothetical protein